MLLSISWYISLNILDDTMDDRSNIDLRARFGTSLFVNVKPRALDN